VRTGQRSFAARKTEGLAYGPAAPGWGFTELAENFVQKRRIWRQASYTKNDPRSHLTVRVGQAARSNDQVFDSRGGSGDILGQ